MSAGPGFFQSEGVRALLARAGRAAGVPVSVHFVMNGHEGPLVIGYGGCAACRHVAEVSGGRAACRKSRSAIAKVALRQRRAVADTCHMGFGVLVTPALTGEGYALTFGPFVPAGGDASLEHDALEGLADVTGELLGAFPVALDDIHRAPSGSMPAVAEWVVEELARLWAAWSEVEEVAEVASGEMGGGKSIAGTRISDAQAIAAAVAGGNRKRVRAILLGAAEEWGALPGKTHIDVRMLALLTECVAACARAGIDTAPAMALMPEAALAFRAVSQEHGQTPEDAGLPVARPVVLTRIAVRVLASLIRKPGERLTGVMREYRALDKLIVSRLPEGVALPEVAAALGKSPAAITLHLQRRFGMSFSEYQGRLRVERAKELLRRTQLPATAIGVRVGIDDQSNFGKLFRRHAGMTPLEYRAAHGGLRGPVGGVRAKAGRKKS